jgi:hypothetical protein
LAAVYLSELEKLALHICKEISAKTATADSKHHERERVLEDQAEWNTVAEGCLGVLLGA